MSHKDLPRGEGERGLSAEVVSAWVVFLTLLGLTLRHFSDGDYTFVVTAGAGVQCLGFWLLLQKVRGGSGERVVDGGRCGRRVRSGYLGLSVCFVVCVARVGARVVSLWR